MAYVKQNKGMDWTDAIVRVLAEEGGGPMSVEDIKRICSAAGFMAVERDTHYNEIG